jgi:hypothetical protein
MVTKKSSKQGKVEPKLNKLQMLRAKYRSFNKPKKFFSIFLLAIFGIYIVHNVVEMSWKPVKDPNYGVSFSYKYAQELGVDWKANYAALLDDLQIRNFRLMSYWDLHEGERGKFDFSTLDYQMDEAAKRGAKVSLSIGLRQPRWPECHQPGWAEALTEETTEWRQALYAYIEVVVTRYKTHPALLSYQLENEAVNNWFGTCKGAAPRDRLFEEVALVKKLDQSHPLWMSLSDQHGFPLKIPRPDAFGFSVYRTVYSTQLPKPFQFYVTYPTPIWYHRARKALIENTIKEPIFIHELQIEPWCPQATVNCSPEEQDKSMSTRQIHKNFDFARKIGAEDIYTWGGEWWYWRMTKFNDPTPWETVRGELAK